MGCSWLQSVHIKTGAAKLGRGQISIKLPSAQWRLSCRVFPGGWERELRQIRDSPPRASLSLSLSPSFTLTTLTSSHKSIHIICLDIVFPTQLASKVVDPMGCLAHPKRMNFRKSSKWPLTVHSKSEPHDPNGAAKKFELSANLSKNATKWPKNDPKWTKVAQI